MLDVHAAQRRNADRPGQHVRNLHLRGIGVTVPDRARELRDFLDQPAKGAIRTPLAVSGAIDGLDTLLKLAEVHAMPPDHRKRGNTETRKPDALAVAVESSFAGSSNEPFALRVSALRPEPAERAWGSRRLLQGVISSAITASAGAGRLPASA